MQGSPSCNRLAASTLLESCQTIDGSIRDAEDFLEDMRSVYAARLAMCEIVSAGSTVPQPCKSLDVSPGTNVHQTSGSKNIRRDQLGLCLQSLESKPQWWTSYSNSKQNAIVMCQAARVDIEKGKRAPRQFLSTANMVPDELINLYKSVVGTNADANAALSIAIKEAYDGLSKYALAVQMSKDRLMHDLEVSSAESQSFFEKLIKRMDTTVQLAISKIGSTVRAVESVAASLSEVSKSGRGRCGPKHSHLSLTCGRTFTKPTSIPRTWRKILEESFSR